MADPSAVAFYGHRFGLYLRNTTSGSEIWVDRVQRAEPTVQYRTNPYYELGRVGKIGVTQDPAEYRVVFDENLHNTEADFLLAGKNPNPAGAQSYHLGDLLGKSITSYLIGRNDAGTIDKELEVTGCRIAEVQFRFTVRDAIMATWTLEGTTGRWYTSGFPHSVWGTLDDVSPGGIHGKEARIWFTSGSLASTRAFRLQAFNVRGVYPIESIRELGRRALVGTLSDSPDVTCDFDLLTTDDQPLDKLFQTSGSGWDLGLPSALFNAYIRVFDPEQAEALNTLKMFRLENCRVQSGTPTRAQVRGLATMRWGLTVAKETTLDSGGLVVSNRNDL